MKLRPLVVLLLTAGGCFEGIDDSPYRIDSPRVLAVRSIPAEVKPGDPVDYELLVAGAEVQPPALFYCTEPRRAEERGAISAACASGGSLVEIEPSTEMLADACARFGPNTPPTEADEPARRPADADSTGGYYVPLVIDLAGQRTTARHRVRCDLANVTREVFSRFQDEYRANQHPSIAGVEGLNDIRAGEARSIEVRVSSDSEESFLRYDPDRAILVREIEELHATFYANGGEVVAGESPVVDGVATIRWNASEQPTVVQAWVVVRDSRGGVDWRELQLEVIAPESTAASP